MNLADREKELDRVRHFLAAEGAQAPRCLVFKAPEAAGTSFFAQSFESRKHSGSFVFYFDCGRTGGSLPLEIIDAISLLSGGSVTDPRARRCDRSI